MVNIIIYSKSACPYCELAKKLLTQYNLNYTEIDIEHNSAKRDEMIKRSKRRTVPQIFINQQAIGGYDDLVKLTESGKLTELVNSTFPPHKDTNL